MPTEQGLVAPRVRGRRHAVHGGDGGFGLPTPAGAWLSISRVRGDVQRPHGAEAGGADLPGPDVLSTSPAHGGRQNPRPGPRAGTDPDAAAGGGARPGRGAPVRGNGAGLHDLPRGQRLLERAAI